MKDFFLAKKKITIKGKITRTALILLGNEESEQYLGSAIKIRWNLKTIDNQDKDFEFFSIPFILTVDEIYSKIRNLKYRYLRDGTLFPDEMIMETKMLNLAIGKLSDEVKSLKKQVSELINEVTKLKMNNSPISSSTENQIESNKDILLDTKEVMKLLGICYNSLYKLMREGFIKPIKINQRRVRFTKISIKKNIITTLN